MPTSLTEGAFDPLPNPAHRSRRSSVFAHGGGVQSTAALVLSATGRIEYPVHLFANVGDDSEHPATLRYVREVSMPYAKAHGIELVELHKHRRDGSIVTLRDRLMAPGGKFMGIPVRLSRTGRPGRRACTHDFKVGVIAAWNRSHGATPASPVTVGLGITLDEIERANKTSQRAYEERAYPLLDLGLTRTDCFDIIDAAGLPRPPKSACFFCPYRTLDSWRVTARDEPELFEEACRIEEHMHAWQDEAGRDRAYFTSRGWQLKLPLRHVVSPAQQPLFTVDHEIETCDEGVCFV
jgi:hypothetical protein